MKSANRRKAFTMAAMAAACLLHVVDAFTACSKADRQSVSSGLWSQENLFAWGVAPFDTKQRNSEERARMLKQLGFKHFAYSWRERHIPTFDTEIETLKRHGINLLAWVLYDADYPTDVNWKDRIVASPDALSGTAPAHSNGLTVQ